MRFSISNFKCAGLFLLTFTVGISGLRFLRGIGAAPIAETPLNPSEYYLATDTNNADHSVLYHGWLGTSDYLRSAQVLILGSSKVGFAFRPDRCRAYFASRGVKHFMLGFGHVETNVFPEALIAKHDLHPRLIVVDASQFFTDEPSAAARGAMGVAGFDAFKEGLEVSFASLVQGSLHQVIPRFFTRPENRLYRSRYDGSWVIPDLPKAASRIEVRRKEPGKAASEVEVMAAQRFVGRMKQRGAQVVFTVVPYPSYAISPVEKLARAAGVPFVQATVDELYAIDPAHLGEESADRWMDALLPSLDPHLAPGEKVPVTFLPF